MAFLLARSQALIGRRSAAAKPAGCGVRLESAVLAPDHGGMSDSKDARPSKRRKPDKPAAISPERRRSERSAHSEKASPSDGFLTGRLLVATPAIGDPRFERTVILICAHDADHAMGLAVNRPVGDLTIGGVLRRLNIESSISLPEDPVLVGGPVQRGRGFVLHTDDYDSPGSTMPVGAGISMTATPDVLEAMAGHNSRPRRSLLALGYAGWAPGQLESELVGNAWLACEADEELVFGHDHEAKWARALAKIGVAPEQLSGLAGRA
jgi:putative transcriptional regulator